jgi:hypothetical protein
VSLGSFGTPLFPLPRKKQNKKNHHKNKGVGRVLFLTHCLSHLLFLVRLLAVWFAYKSAVMMLLIVPVRVQDSRCMGPGSVSWDFTIPAGVRLLVVLLVVVWLVVSDMLIYVGFSDVYMFCVLHVLYIYVQVLSENHRCMARGGHGLRKVSPGRTMPDSCMPCEWATPETALRPFQG